jgi:anti-sigma regulatory factor (Ser/Thr protein kinase)
MPSPAAALRHNAFLYESEDEYLARAVPFLRAALEAGEGAIVAHTGSTIPLMREALGPDAGQVTFVDVSSAYTRPAHTLAAYHRVYAAQLRRTPRVRAVADVQFGPDPGEWDLWTGYEAVFNRCFAHLPVWVLCSYNANGTPDPIIDGVWRTHPEVVDRTDWTTSRRFEAPERLLRAITPAPAALPQLRSLRCAPRPERIRECLAPELLAAGLSEARTLDALLAISEIANNAIQHGGGITDLATGIVDGRFVCQITDRGAGFDDPAAGYLAPGGGAGNGLWVVRQLTWRLEFLHGAGGFTARIWV